MNPTIDRIVQNKLEKRRELASRPVGEKLRIVEELAERTLATRKDTSASIADEPWEIPSTWHWKKMGDVAKVVGGGTPRTDHPEYFGGDIPWITPADLSKYSEKTISRGARNITRSGLENSGAQLLPERAVLFSSRAPIGYVAIAANPVATNQGFKSFIPSEQLEPDFVYYYLLRARELAVALASGTTFLEISGKNAARLPIPVPPVAEQQRIVGEIEKQCTRLEVAVIALRRAQANLKRYRTALLAAAFEGRLVPRHARPLSHENKSTAEFLKSILADPRRLTGRIKQGRSSETSLAGLPELPTGWEWCKLEQLAWSSSYGTSAKCSHENSGPPVLRIPNIANGRVDTRDLKFADACNTSTEDWTVSPGDLLVIRTNGSRALIGRGAVVREPLDRATGYASYLIRFRLLGPPQLSYWISTIWNAPFIRTWMEEHSATSAGQYNLSMTTLNNLPIPLPSFEEQQLIVAEVERRLSLLDEMEEVVAANFQRAARLRQSILERAFSGRLIKSNATGDSAAKSKTRSPASRRHFLRVLLSAEIVHQLHAEPTFGQTKHQKIFHLCEHIAQIAELDVQYHREAAGPYDNHLIHANEADLKKLKWYEQYSRKKVGHAYRPLTKAGDHEKYLQRYWPDKLETIRRLIQLMRRWDTEQCEIFSTAYAAWNDLLLWGQEATDDAILHEVLDHWHENKRRIPEARWRKALEWMRREGFVPTGFGKATATPERS